MVGYSLPVLHILVQFALQVVIFVSFFLLWSIIFPREDALGIWGEDGHQERAVEMHNGQWGFLCRELKLNSSVPFLATSITALSSTCGPKRVSCVFLVWQRL